VGASSIVVEGYKAYNLSPSGGQIDLVEREVSTMVRLSPTTPERSAIGGQILDHLLSGQANAFTIPVCFHVEPGAELDNPDGDLTLAGKLGPFKIPLRSCRRPRPVDAAGRGNLNFDL